MATDDKTVVKFDPTAYVEAIRNKIKDALVGMIPDEQWNAMLEQQIKAFTQPKVDGSGYHQRTVPSELDSIINRILTEEVTKRVREMLLSPEWQPRWAGIFRIAGEAVGKVAAENGAAIINAWLAQAVQDFVSRIAVPR